MHINRNDIFTNYMYIAKHVIVTVRELRFHLRISSKRRYDTRRTYVTGYQPTYSSCTRIDSCPQTHSNRYSMSPCQSIKVRIYMRNRINSFDAPPRVA